MRANQPTLDEQTAKLKNAVGLISAALAFGRNVRTSAAPDGDEATAGDADGDGDGGKGEDTANDTRQATGKTDDDNGDKAGGGAASQQRSRRKIGNMLKAGQPSIVDTCKYDCKPHSTASIDTDWRGGCLLRRWEGQTVDGHPNGFGMYFVSGNVNGRFEGEVRPSFTIPIPLPTPY